MSDADQSLAERIDTLEHIVMLLVRKRNIATPAPPPRPASPVLAPSSDICELKKSFLSYRRYTDAIMDALKAFSVSLPITDRVPLDVTDAAREATSQEKLASQDSIQCGAEDAAMPRRGRCAAFSPPSPSPSPPMTRPTSPCAVAATTTK
jgi:hypothetical protein